MGLLFLLAAVGMGFRAWYAQRDASVVVDWSTASEIDTAGYNLYRRDSADGHLIQINEFLIPALSDPLAGGEYHFTDTQVEAGRTYFYELETVETSGATTRYGPIDVKAEPAGQIETVLAGLLAIASAILLLLPRLKKKA